MPPNDITVANGSKDVAAATADFKNKVAESKIKIAIETPPPKIPGKRGRKSNEERARLAAIASGAGVAAASVQTGPSLDPGTPTPDISRYLVNPLIGLSKFPANHYEIPELALTVDEATVCAQSLNDLLNVFAPTIGAMSPKTMAILSAATTIGTIGFSKYQVYASKTQEKRAKPPPQMAPATAPGEPFPVIRADGPAPAPPQNISVTDFLKTQGR